MKIILILWELSNEKFTYNQVAGNVGLTGNYIEIKEL